MFDIQSIRDQFSVLPGEISGHISAYLDNAASAQKLRGWLAKS